jgi:hypothetical protein
MRGTGDHLEPIYVNDGTLVAQRDTLLLPPNSSPQVAVAFANVNDGNGGACRNHITVTDSLLAGGGYPIEMCANGNSVGSSTMNIADNHFARCTSRPIVFNRGSGGTACAGYRGGPRDLGRGRRDAHGYWPQGGYYGHVVGAYCPPTAGQTWTGNVWDDDVGRVRCR